MSIYAPERHLIPIEEESLWDDEYSTVFQAIHRRPYVGLLFVAPGMYWGRQEGHVLEREIANKYGKYFRGQLIAVGCNQVLMDEARILSCIGPEGPANGTLGLFFSFCKNLQIHVAYDDTSKHVYSPGPRGCLTNDFVDGFVDKLEFQHLEDGDDNRDSTAVVILFANSFAPLKATTDLLFQRLRQRCEQRKIVLWGGYTNDDISVAENSGRNMNVINSFYVALRLSGRKIKAWSTVIGCSSSRSAIYGQLIRFKRTLKLRKRSMILLSGPASAAFDEEQMGENFFNNCQEVKNMVRQLFPNIPFIGTFYNQPYSVGNISSVDGKFEYLF